MIDSLQQPVATGTLLETKLYLPRWRPGLVRRARLIERLDQVTERTLTLVSAPAGFGKTTLLAEWLASAPASERAVGWISLDQSDNDPVSFWTYVISALQNVQSEVGEKALSLLHAPQPPSIESVLTTLINEITAVEGDFVLVLDDLHVIDAKPVHEGMVFLLDHLPPRMHLVIASRSDPPWPLARLRGRGEVIELRAADLRFAPDEAAAFLNDVMGLNLSTADAMALETRTEGWIVGLQLAALSMHGRTDLPGFIRAFAGDDRYVVDYLVEEVLQRQPEHVRNFLLQTSMLDRLNGPLCDAVTGRNDGSGLLEALERGDLFVVPLDDKRQWYRYHHLFADVIRAHAMEEQPDRVPTLRSRAAAWFEAKGMIAEAIEQARAAMDHEAVARLLVAHVEELERSGRHASIARWSASLPDEMLQTRPRLAIIRAKGAMQTESSLATTRKVTSWAEEAINAIESRGELDPSEDIDGTIVGPDGLDTLKGETLALKLATTRDLTPEAVARIANQALELLPPSKYQVRGMIHLINSGIQTSLNDLGSALPTLERSIDEARRVQDPSLLSCVLAQRGQVNVAMGRLDEGRRSYEEALSLGKHASTEADWALCGPHAWLAEVLLEQGDLAGATDHVAKARELASTAPMKSYVLYARTIAAQVSLAAGDTDAALARLAEAQEFAKGARHFRFASFLSSVELKLHCRMGNLDSAADIVRNRGLTPEVAVDYDNEEEVTAYARYLITCGGSHDATNVLSRVIPIVRGGGRVQHEIHALALRAVAHEHLNKRTLALESLGRATMLAEPGRFSQTFTGEGPVMTGSLDALADAVRRNCGPAETGSLPYLTSLLQEAGIERNRQSTPPGSATLVEPLTTREIEILRLIATGLRNKDIGDRLFISVATVKRHIANAYRKLDVSHRTEAIARANELNLL